MRTVKKVIATLLSLIIVNTGFAKNFYYQSANNSTHVIKNLGDSNFKYSITYKRDQSEEFFEKDLTRIIVVRKKESPTMWVEQRTKFGFLTLKYVYSNKIWAAESTVFRPYRVYFKASFQNDSCIEPNSEKNLDDISSIESKIKNDNIKNLLFDQSCQDSLTATEYSVLVNTTYSLLTGDLSNSQKPKILACLTDQANNSKIREPFIQLRQDVSNNLRQAKSMEEVKKNTAIPFPIYCSLDNQSQKTCGTTKEDKKTKISLDVNCLKKINGDKDKIISLLMHELSHTFRLPKSDGSKQLETISEAEIQAIEKGNCDPKSQDNAKDSSVGAIDITQSKNTSVKNENSKLADASQLPADVANPYNSFIDRQSNSTLPTTTSEFASATTSDSPSRYVASANYANSNSSLNVNYPTNSTLPSLQQRAQYENVKAYVDTSMNTVAKRIAPIVSYVESPAFAKSLPKNNFEDSDSADFKTAESLALSDTSTSAKVATVANKAVTRTKRSNETAASSNNGQNPQATVVIKSPNLGDSLSASYAPNQPEVIPSAERISSSPSLDNAYALKVRKRLLSDSTYRTELRKKGIKIDFADGYKFEAPNIKVFYTEKNGVLVRGP